MVTFADFSEEFATSEIFHGKIYQITLKMYEVLDGGISEFQTYQNCFEP